MVRCLLHVVGHSTSQTQQGTELLTHFPAPQQGQGQSPTLPLCCPSQVARSVSVHGHGYLTLALTDVPGLRDFYSGFSFQTSQREGLLYHHSTQVGTRRPPDIPAVGLLGRVLLPLGKEGILVGPGCESAVRSAP